MQKKLNGVDPKKFNLCFFGTLGNQFQFDKLIEIAEQLKNEDIGIYICGLGPCYDYIKQNTEHLPNLKMLNWLDKEELKYVLQSSNIGIANYKPTFDFQMGASNKFAEYLSYGLPIILTSGGYMGELIDKYECGINSDSVKNIMKYVIDLKNDRTIYEEKSQNAYELYKNKFNAARVYAELVDYIERVKEK